MGRIESYCGLVIEPDIIDLLVHRATRQKPRHDPIVATARDRRSLRRPQPRIIRVGVALNPSQQSFAKFYFFMRNRATQLAEVISGNQFWCEIRLCEGVQDMPYRVFDFINRQTRTSGHGRRGIIGVLAGAGGFNILRPLPFAFVKRKVVLFALDLFLVGCLPQLKPFLREIEINGHADSEIGLR